MKSVYKMLALTTLVAACSAAHAADSANLTLKGTITPSSCTPTLTNSEFAYHSISGLNQKAPALLSELTSNLTILCNNAVKVGFKVVDDRAGSSPWTKFNSAAGADLQAFGLGFAPNGTTKIGGYTMALDNLQVTTSTNMTFPGQMLSSLDGLTGWTHRSDVVGLDTTNTYAIERSLDGGPYPYKIYTGNLRVQAQIDSMDNLGAALSNNLALNGQATINLVYL